jgi:hypothetical protein
VEGGRELCNSGLRTSNGIIFISNFIKIYQLVQNLFEQGRLDKNWNRHINEKKNSTQYFILYLKQPILMTPHKKKYRKISQSMDNAMKHYYVIVFTYLCTIKYDKTTPQQKYLCFWVKVGGVSWQVELYCASLNSYDSNRDSTQTGTSTHHSLCPWWHNFIPWSTVKKPTFPFIWIICNMSKIYKRCL